jgi:hypothetical protein
MEAFRSVALRIPWVYVLDRTGTLCVFRIPSGEPAKELLPTKLLFDVGDGNDLKIFGDVLICTRSGGIEAYSLQKPGEPQHIGGFGPLGRFDSPSIVRNGSIAFVVGRKAIQSYDLSVPREPKFLGTSPIKHPVWTGCAAGHFLYVGELLDSRRGITVYDVSEPAHPIEGAFLATAHAPYHLFSTPNQRLIASLDGELSHSASPSHITVNGNSLVFDLTDPRRPVQVKEYGLSGGRTAALLTVANQSYFACDGVIFSVKNDGLEPDSVFLPEGSTLDGEPYHGDAEGTYVALAGDNVTVVLRLKENEVRRPRSQP